MQITPPWAYLDDRGRVHLTSYGEELMHERNLQMTQTPKTITVDIRSIPGVQELLEQVWDDGFWRGHAIRKGDEYRNPYQMEES